QPLVRVRGNDWRSVAAARGMAVIEMKEERGHNGCCVAEMVAVVGPGKGCLCLLSWAGEDFRFAEVCLTVYQHPSYRHHHCGSLLLASLPAASPLPLVSRLSVSFSHSPARHHTGFCCSSSTLPWQTPR